MSDYTDSDAYKYYKLSKVYMDAYWATINALKEHKPLETQGYLNRELFGINSKLLLDIERIDKEVSNERKEV